MSIFALAVKRFINNHSITDLPIMDNLLRRFALAAISFVIMFTGCKSLNVDPRVANAEAQLKILVKASEDGDTLRIPSSFNGSQVTFVDIDDWVSGFFAGELWYMYELTGNEFWAEKAKAFTEILSPIQYLTWHHDVGFMIYDSYGNGLRLKNIESYNDVILNTAKSLSTRFRPAAGVLQSWNADRGWQAERGWACPVIIDNMMNLELLFKATEISGDSTYYNIAVSHADKTLENHFRDDYSCYHVVDYDPETGQVRRKCTAQGYADNSSWARGQAWAIYGFTLAYRFTGYERYLKQAESVANFILTNKNMPEDLVPYWDYNAPDIPAAYRDVSAASITASALYDLYKLTDNGVYLEKGDKIIESLSAAPYLAEKGTNGGFILKHSVGSIPHGRGIDVPLNYADYYYLEALVRRRNIK